MKPIDLLRSLKSQLEVEAHFSETPIVVEIDATSRPMRAIVAIEVEGRTRLMTVEARDYGFSEALTLEA